MSNEPHTASQPSLLECDMIMKGGIRSEEADEIEGLDMPEMGVYAYPEFDTALASVGAHPPMSPEAPSPTTF